MSYQHHEAVIQPRSSQTVTSPLSVSSFSIPGSMCWGIVDEVTPYSVHLHGGKALFHQRHKMFLHRFVIGENPWEGKSFRCCYFLHKLTQRHAWCPVRSNPAYRVYNSRDWLIARRLCMKKRGKYQAGLVNELLIQLVSLRISCRT